MGSGYLWADDTAPAHVRSAEPGGLVRMPSPRPPWLVVYTAPGRVLVTGWPGRLWRVEIMPPAAEPERAALAEITARIAPGAGYTHASRVEVVAEVSPALPFGAHGDAVARVVEAGQALDEPTAHRLAEARRPEAGRAYVHAWLRWSAEPRGWGVNSPVGSGLGLLGTVVQASARLRGGPGAWVVDGDGENVVAEPWCSAYGALREAALAYGAPHLVDGAARELLAAPWDTVYGPLR
ncbi:hypothetical protein CS0771_61050 [Catellatospora sp. IY07-71]|uniref:hypothetical protein n=1 Tax=Catellatospora sp. IY07-71 TaxID=2728827 RepID=UPI001BB35E0C|nr:hypothetical protein [Catellatospora sp. IY07-71]BCJ76561.1 hypothetical protein CS0771_61050 [Catellatospora sp. IY07-71]